MNIKLKYLCLAHRKHPDKAHLWMTASRKRLTHPPQRLLGTRKFLFCIKETWVLTQARRLSGTWGHHLFGLLAFWIKSLFLAPTSCLSIYWHIVWWAVRAWKQYNFWWSKNVTPLGEFSGRFSAAVRTTCPEDLLFRFPQSSPPCPRTWQLDQRINIWEPVCSTQKGKSLQCVQLETLFSLCLGLLH